MNSTNIKFEFYELKTILCEVLIVVLWWSNSRTTIDMTVRGYECVLVRDVKYRTQYSEYISNYQYVSLTNSENIPGSPEIGNSQIMCTLNLVSGDKFNNSFLFKFLDKS